MENLVIIHRESRNRKSSIVSRKSKIALSSLRRVYDLRYTARTLLVRYLLSLFRPYLKNNPTQSRKNTKEPFYYSSAVVDGLEVLLRLPPLMDCSLRSRS